MRIMIQQPKQIQKRRIRELISQSRTRASAVGQGTAKITNIKVNQRLLGENAFAQNAKTEYCLCDSCGSV